MTKYANVLRRRISLWLRCFFRHVCSLFCEYATFSRTNAWSSNSELHGKETFYRLKFETRIESESCDVLDRYRGEKITEVTLYNNSASNAGHLFFFLLERGKQGNQSGIFRRRRLCITRALATLALAQGCAVAGLSKKKSCFVEICTY